MVGVENGSSKYDEVELYTFTLTWILVVGTHLFSVLYAKYSIFIVQ